MEQVSGMLLIIIPLAFSLTTTLAIHTTGGLNPTQQEQAPAAAPTTANNAEPPNIDTIVQKACHNAADNYFCVSTLKSKPEIEGLDLKGLAFLTLKMAKEHANTSAAFIDGQIKEEDDLDSHLDQAYNDCKEEYDDVLAQIEDSMQAFLANNARDVNTFMTAAIAATLTCQQSVKASGGLSSPLYHSNEMLMKLCNIALSATTASLQQ